MLKRSIRNKLSIITLMILIMTVLPVSQVSAASLGPNDAGTAADVSRGAGYIAWTSPGYITAGDTNYATISLDKNEVSNYLRGTGYGFTIPATATIDGITVVINRYKKDNGFSIADEDVYLLKGLSPVGMDNAKTGTDWPAVTPATATYGGASDKWGENWSPSDINSTNFGVVLSVARSGTGANAAQPSYVDYIQITVAYTYVPITTTTDIDCGTGTVTYGESISCTATVTASSGTVSPTGRVNWSPSDSGSFSPETYCELSSTGSGTADCPITYIPSIVGTDPHSLTADYVGDINFSGSSGEQDVTVNKRPITVTAVIDSREYDGTTDSSGTPTITSGSLASGDDDTGSWSQSFDDRNAGSGKTLTPEGAVNDGNSGLNYDVTFEAVTSGEITTRPITVTAVTDSREYDGTTDSSGVPTITGGSLASGDDDTGSWFQSFDDRNAGSGKTLTPDGAVNDGNSGLNYAVTFEPVSSGEITTRPLTVTADAKTKRLGETDPVLTFQVTSGSLVSGDAFSGALAREVGEATGAYAILQGSLVLSSNYTLTFISADLTINGSYVYLPMIIMQ
jgi:hypothetical protein